MSENEFWITLWVAILLVCGGVAGLAIHNSFKENRLYIEHGYTQKAVPGFSYAIWTKE